MKNKNSKKEKKFCKAFKHFCDKKNIYNDINPCYKNKPDVSFVYKIFNTKYCFVLEAKISNKYNIANYAKQLFGEIMINRKNINRISSLTCGATIIYGIFLKYYMNPKKNDIYNYLVKHINQQEWDAFGNQFNCKYVFLFDEINEVLYYIDWNLFLKGNMPTKLV